MASLCQYSQHLAQLLPTVGGDDFPRLLSQMLMQLVPCDDATVILYPEAGMPVIIYSAQRQAGGSSTLDVFVRGAFLLDPYYLAATRENKFGLFHLRALAPSRFRDSEYYKSWNRNCGYQDECGYLVKLGNDSFANIALGKTSARASFSKAQLATLNAVQPVVETLCRQHWADSGLHRPESKLRAQLHSALDAFGSSLLTEREAQVINLVLHGHSTKTLAEKLSISVETVKLHRKHAYAKLEVRSQAELFYLFLDSVMSARDYQGGDTLEAYMRAPSSAEVQPPEATAQFMDEA